MMYKLIEQKNNIQQLSIINSNLTFLKEGVFYCGINAFNIKPMWYKTDITQKNIWIKDIQWEDYMIDLELKILYKLDCKIGLNGKIEDCILIFKNNQSICYDILQKKEYLIKVDNEKYYIKYRESLICQIREITLKSLSLLTGEYEWEVDLGGKKFIFGGEEQEAKISQIIGVIEGNLYVWMSDERLVEIDVQTGKIKTETFPLQALQAQGVIQAVLFPQYYEKEQSLFFFYQDYLVQVHLQTQTTTLLWQDTHYNIGLSFITEQYIYFIGNYEKGTFFRNHIGVFDRQKNKVVWMQQVITLSKETYNNLKEIQATDSKIYVLDTEGTLYIYERETEVKNDSLF